MGKHAKLMSSDKTTTTGPNNNTLLEVRGLRTHFFTEDGVVKAVDGASFAINSGEVFGLVGESGCGKSVTALTIMRLIDEPGKIVEGEIIFDGVSLLDLTEDEMRRLRGSRISMIFQEPQAGFNPVFPIGRQVAEVLELHQGMSRRNAWARAVELLEMVSIADAAEKAKAYPHEVSGGQAQRVMIAMSLALNPQLLIADEPTTALDVTIQAQILDLIRDLSERQHTTVILITHDLSVVAEMCDRTAVMYAGYVVEEADVTMLFDEPLHPYTQGLIGSMPLLGEERERLDAIPGTVPDLVNLPLGCRFAERCRAREAYDLQICTRVEPQLSQVRPDHSVRCWLYESHEDHQAPIQVAVTDVTDKD